MIRSKHSDHEPSAGGSEAPSTTAYREAHHRMKEAMGQPYIGDPDVDFMRGMIPHHEGAIDMAKIALERSKRPEIISLANGIIEAQQREINDMKGWYQSWFGSAPPQGGIGMHGGGMMHMGGMMGDTDDLKSVAAADFDREFIDQMIPHHEMAVMMASRLTRCPALSTSSCSKANDFGRKGSSDPSDASSAPRARSRVKRSKR